jgi:hypothetical protein
MRQAVRFGRNLACNWADIQSADIGHARHGSQSAGAGDVGMTESVGLTQG